MIAPKALKSTTITTKQKLMYYLGAFMFMLVYTIMAYSMAVFIIEKFPNNPNAIFLVGVILAIANFLGLFLNGIWLYMQKTVQPKTLVLISIVGLLLSSLIFLLGNIFFSILSLPAFTVLAAFAYIWSFDIYDITMTTLILNKSTEKTQASEFSQKKVAESIGMLSGIIIGGVLLVMGSVTTQFFLSLLLIGTFIYFKQNFENKNDENIMLQFSDKDGIDWKEILKNIGKSNTVKEKLNNTKNETQQKALHISQAVESKINNEINNRSLSQKKDSNSISKTSAKFLNEGRLLLLDILAKDNEVKRIAVPKHNFHIKEILSEISSSFSVIGKSFSIHTRYGFFWACTMVMFFSFWDTMAITYQPIFLERFREDLGIFVAFIMPLFILPVFLLQIPAGKLTDKWGTHTMMMIGLFLSAISLIIMGNINMFNGSVLVLILSGIGNSVGYTAAFSASQVHFSNEIKYYLKTHKQKISNGLLAASLRLALNIGNIIGQLFGGLIFSILGFLSGFFTLGTFLLLLAFISLFFIKTLKIPNT